MTVELFILTFFIGILGTIGLVAFYQGMKAGNPSLVGTISSSFIAVSVILSTIIFHESIGINQLIAIILIFMGVFIASFDFKSIKSGVGVNKQAIIFALIAMFVWGFYVTLIKIPIASLGWFLPSVIISFSVITLIIFMLIRRIKFVSPLKNGAFIPFIMNFLLLFGADFTFNYALSKGASSVVVPISGSSVTLFVVLSFFIFKDPITKQQIIGIITTLIGIVLLSIFSV